MGLGLKLMIIKALAFCTLACQVKLKFISTAHLTEQDNQQTLIS